MFSQILEKGELQVSCKEREQQCAVREEYARTVGILKQARSSHIGGHT
jgi:ribosome maturation protein Sdo1